MRRRGRGEGSIRQRKKDLWEGRIYVGTDQNGQPIRKSVTGKTKAEVVKKLAALKLEQPRTTHSFETLEQSIEIWLQAKKHSITKRTYESYESTYRVHIKPRSPDAVTAHVGADYLIRLLNQLHNHGAHSRTTQIAHTILRQSLDLATKRGIIQHNPARDVPKPAHQRQPPASLSPTQAQQLLDTTKKRPLHALYVTAIYTGMRLGELLALQWQHVDLQNKTISIVATLEESSSGWQLKPPKSKKSRRTIPIAPPLLQTLQSIPQNPPFVFHTSSNQPLRRPNVARWFKQDLDLANLPRIRFHDLRRSTASILAAAGVPPRDLQDWLGHADIHTTLAVYTDVVAEAHRIAAEKLHSALENPNGGPMGDKKTPPNDVDGVK